MPPVAVTGAIIFVPGTGIHYDVYFVVKISALLLQRYRSETSKSTVD